MARKLRIEYPGAIYHVVNRGDRQEPIFVDDEDRRIFLQTLTEASAKTDWLVHAYCLMPNHFHLLVETPTPNLVAGMKWFLGTYTSRFNRRHKVSGHLFGGRYKALVVDGSGNGYLKTVADYVHLNPVRANLIPKDAPLDRYSWSSYPDYLKAAGERPSWLRVTSVLGEHGIQQDNPDGRSQFKQRMETRRLDPHDPEHNHIRRGWCFGKDTFRRELLGQIGRQLPDGEYASEQFESSEEKARAIVAEELAALGWNRESLVERTKSDPEKLRIASRLRSETPMTIKWIAAALEMGSWRYLATLLASGARSTQERPKVTKPQALTRTKSAGSEVTPEQTLTTSDVPAILWD